MSRPVNPQGKDSTDPLAAIGADLLREDPELRALAKDVYRSAMSSMLRDLKAGTHAVKLPIYRLLLPSIMKEAGRPTGESDPAVVVNDLFKELRATLTGGNNVPGPAPSHDTPHAEGDIHE